MRKLTLAQIKKQDEAKQPLWALRREYRDGQSSLSYYVSYDDAWAATATVGRKVRTLSIIAANEAAVREDRARGMRRQAKLVSPRRSGDMLPRPSPLD